MKKLFTLFFALLLLTISSWAQTTTATIGTGTDITSGTASSITPYKTYWMDGQDQILFTAAELTAAGLAAGNITKLAFNVGGIVDPFTLTSFTISMQHTALTALTGFITTGWTQVYTANVVAALGWNTYTFTTPFTWNGTSNLVFKVCFNNTDYAENTHVYYTSTPSSGVHYYDGSDLATTSGCDQTVYDGQAARPNVRITGQASAAPLLSAIPGSLAFGYVPFGSSSIEKSYVLSGSNLTAGPIVVTAPAGFGVSLATGGPYTSSINVTYTPPTLPNTTIYSQFTPLAANTNYSGNITNAGGGAATVNVAVTGSSDLYSLYCPSSATTVDDEDIFNVTVGTINNTSTCATLAPGVGSVQNMYSNYYFDVAPADLSRATAVNFSIGLGTCGGSYGNAIKIFVDFNQDGDFADAGEEVYVSAASTTGPHTETGSFTIPLGAALGYTMMRVVNVETVPSGITACGTYSWGETEDYKVNITPAPPACVTPSAQPTALILTPTQISMDGSFTPAAGADNYLVVRSLNSSLSATPVDGTIYAVGSALGGGIVDYFGASATFTSTGLTANTLYYYFVFAANHATCLGGPAYLITNPLSGNQTTLPIVPISGTKNIGPTGDYFSLTDAFQDAYMNGVNGPLNLVLQSSYVSSVETFPILAQNISGSSAINKITVYPSVTGLSITSSNATGTINLNGVTYVVFDGRVNATGTGKDLIIENSSTSGYAINFVNGASYNGIQFCILKGASTLTSNGIVTFAGTTSTIGNSNNLIDNCEIRDGVSSPLYAVYSSGSSTPSAFNRNNTISNSLIHDFFAPGGGNPLGIALYGSSAWTISGNSFYQVTAKSPTGANGYNVIFIASGDGYNILNNYIGGSAPNCGGAPWTLNGNGTPPTIANFIYAIRFAAGFTSNASSINGNTISNILLYTNPAAASIYFLGYLSVVGIQNISNNVIGSATGAGSITVSVGNGLFTSSYEGIDFRGMYGNVTNNTFGSFTISGTATSTSTYALTIRPFGISPTVQNGTVTVSGNLAGSLTTANSIQTPVMAFPPVQIQGLFVVSTGSGTMSVANNNIANISNLSSHITSHLIGVYSGGTALPNVLSYNTVRDLTTASTNLTIAGIASLNGIYSLNSVPGSIIRSNNIYNLTNTSLTAAAGIHGMYLGHSNGDVLVEKNFIHNIGLSSSSATSQVNGLYLNTAGTYVTTKNNMIQLGVNPDGSANTSSCIINGIYEFNAASSSVLNNSVYIGGAPAIGVTGNTYAFNSNLTPSLATPRVCLDNVFFNARSGGSTGKHYGIMIAGTTTFPLGVTSNYNLIIANGTTGGTFGRFNAIDRATFAAYKDATGTEMASGNANPNFIAANGNFSTANLHVQNPTPIEGAGLALASVTDDFDGEIRTGLTPPDIGADAGNFTLSADVFGPNINYIAIGNGTATNRTLNNWATITDNVGVSGGSDLPRIYFKKSTDADAFVGNTSADNGWKYAFANNSSSPYSFVIDYGIINGGSVTAGNIIQYFVVAQDAANNLSSNYPMAGASANPPVQNINAKPSAVQTYTIVANTIPTTINVPGTYANLTGTGGAFDMINQGLLSGNTTINITGNLTEPGTVALNAWSEDIPGSNYSLLIQPDGTTLRTIIGTAVATGIAMIRTNGASRLTIDGGTNKLLTFRNTNATPANTGPTIQFNGGSQACFIKNSTIENNGTTATYGAVNLGSTGTNIVEISGNDVRDATAGTAGLMATGIYCSSITNSLSVLNNNIFNFIKNGINIANVADGAVITGNSFYYNSATVSTATQYCINLVGATNNHTISSNYFGGQSPLCGGMPWTNSTTNTIYGIYATPGIISPSTIANNTVQNFNLTNVGSASFYGIYITGGVVNVLNNEVGSSTVLNSIASLGTGGFYGIYATPSATAPSYVQGNTVSGISYTSTTNSGTFYFLYLSTGLLKVGTTSPNIIGSNTTAGAITYAGTGTLYGIYCSSSNPGNAIENNIIGNWSLTGITGSPNARGMYIYSANVKKNKIFNISCANTGLTPSIYGIYNYGSSSANITNEYSTNLISLNGGSATNPALYGFYDNSYTTAFYNLYYNTINISGTASGTSSTYAFYRNVGAFYTIRDNIFSNTRVVAGGTSKHYAAYLSSIGAWNSDYNDIYSASGPLGYYNAADQPTIVSWKTATGGDANSQNVDPQFPSATDLHTSRFELNNTGIAIPGITTDYDGVTRKNPPDIGAYEFSLITTYTWIGADNGAWTTPTNWTPTRTVPETTDILQFNDGTTKNVTGVPTQTIGKLIMSNNTIINLQSSAATTLSISGGDAADLDIPAGCALNMNTVNAITLALGTGATGSISGSMRFSATASTAHRLTAVDAGAITFNSGATFTAGTFFNGNAFGQTNLGSVIFANGSTYIAQSGSNPFGASQPNSVVVFQTGSLFKVIANLTPAFSGRTYANFEMDATGALVTTSGGSPVSIDNLTITNGTLNFNVTATPGHSIKGNIQVASGGTLNFAPASAGTVLLNGTSAQSISGPGTIATAANSTLEIANSNGVTLNTPVTMNGHLKLTNGLLTLGTSNLTMGSASTISGTPSASAMIVATGTGQLRKGFTAAGSFTFPVGDNTVTAEYSPVTLNFASGTFGAGNYVGVNLVNAKYPVDPNTDSYLYRYWNLEQSGITGFNCNATFQYVPADVNGTESDIYCMRVFPTPFTTFDPANTSLHQLTASGLTTLSTFTGSESPFITVTSPDGGEDWLQGSTNDITWDDNIVDNVKIDLYKGGVFLLELVASTASTGTWSWTIPADQTPGTDYKVKITSTADITLFDLSDADFTITASGPPPTRDLRDVTIASGQSECYDATQTITVAGGGTIFLLQNGGTATMIAGQNIIYYPGTTVEAGGTMHGYIAPGGPWCGAKAPAIPAVVTGVENVPFFSSDIYFKVYPNPTTGNFTLEQMGEKMFEKVNVEVYSMLGDRVLKSEMIGEKMHEFSLSDVPVGVYFIKVLAGEKPLTIKIIKQ